MPTLLSARSRGAIPNAAAAAVSTEDAAGGRRGNGACYAIAACAVALLLFCALATTVNVRMASAFGGLALVAFAIAGCLAPSGSRGVGHAGELDGVSAAEATSADAEAAARAKRRLGMPKAAIDALPTFAYTVVVKGDGNIESGPSGVDADAIVEQCSVCLEDFEAGEMVRRLPACGHLFHVECIDMWLDSHRTCPVCRCNLLRSQRKVAKVKAAEPAPAAGEEEELPAQDALPPV
nr:unnamed protein product [Digitaria exilis]